ncbi:hypothetical protein LPJ56_006656, partial [Coemansia sp. RSA 2599]
MSIGSAMASAGAGIPSPVPQLDHRRLSADTAAGAYALGNFDLSGGLWQSSVASPTTAVAPTVSGASMVSGGLDRTGSLPISIGGGSSVAMVSEDIPLQQQMGANGLSSPLTPTGGEESAQSKSAKRSFSASMEKAPKVKGGGGGGRGRKPAAASSAINSNGNASLSSSVAGATASTAIPHKAAGTQQLEKLQRLEELRARVVLLQQLSGQHAAANSADGGPAGATDPSAVSSCMTGSLQSSLSSSSPAAAVSSSAGILAGSKDVNGFLNNFAASIGSVASQLGSLPEAKSGPSVPAQPAAPKYSTSSATSSTSPPQQFHSDEGAWLANALSQQTGLDASGS